MFAQRCSRCYDTKISTDMGEIAPLKRVINWNLRQGWFD